MQKVTVLAIRKYYQRIGTAETLTVTIELPKEGPLYQHSFFLCSSCNELFAIDDQKLSILNNNIFNHLGDKRCPICSSILKDTLLKCVRHNSKQIEVNKIEWKEIAKTDGPFEYIDCYNPLA